MQPSLGVAHGSGALAPKKSLWSPVEGAACRPLEQAASGKHKQTTANVIEGGCRASAPSKLRIQRKNCESGASSHARSTRARGPLRAHLGIIERENGLVGQSVRGKMLRSGRAPAFVRRLPTSFADPQPPYLLLLVGNCDVRTHTWVGTLSRQSPDRHRLTRPQRATPRRATRSGSLPRFSWRHRTAFGYFRGKTAGFPRLRSRSPCCAS